MGPPSAGTAECSCFCLQRTNSPIILSHLAVGCLGGTPTTHLAGHLVQIRASLPGRFGAEPFIFNSLIWKGPGKCSKPAGGTPWVAFADAHFLPKLVSPQPTVGTLRLGYCGCHLFTISRSLIGRDFLSHNTFRPLPPPSGMPTNGTDEDLPSVEDALGS
jgi:hypothetical protein